MVSPVVIPLKNRFQKVFPTLVKVIKKLRRILRGNDYYVHKTAILKNKHLIEIGYKAEIKEFVIIQASTNKISIGAHTQLNPFTVIYGSSEITIGNNVMIAPHCMIASGNHDYKQSEKPMRWAGYLSKGPIIIKDDVWIGANTTITDGVTIHEGAVIAANSLVNRDVLPFEIVGGVPVKSIKSRKT